MHYLHMYEHRVIGAHLEHITSFNDNETNNYPKFREARAEVRDGLIYFMICLRFMLQKYRLKS